MKTAYKLFKENLGKAEMLTYVHVFNLSNWALELDFVLGQKDKAQWNVSYLQLAQAASRAPSEVALQWVAGHCYYHR